jgi:hypothetical protein
MNQDIGVMSHEKVIDEEAGASPELTELPELRKEEGPRTPSVSSNDSKTPVPVAELDWDSPEDSGNPRNWPTWKRVFHTSIPALYGFIM